MNKRKLLRLAKHLESGKLFVDKFEFGQVFRVFDGQRCGCAIPECVKLWPKEVKIVGSDVIGPNESEKLNIMCEVFGLSGPDASKLFVYDFCGNGLRYNASPKEVAAGIRRFCDQS